VAQELSANTQPPILVVGQGACFGFGGTNARYGRIFGNNLSGYESKKTPDTPDKFFGWTGRLLLEAADQGAEWVVAGFPGPVTPDGRIVGPMTNVSGLENKRYDLAAELTKTDPAIERLLSGNFLLIAVNDGELAAQAVAARMGQAHNNVAALIMGTGQGTGVVKRDSTMTEVFRADRVNPFETGHLIRDPRNIGDTFENRIAGPAIERRAKMSAKDIPVDHPIWREVGEEAGLIAHYLGLISGVELVVPTGGVGAGASDKFSRHMEQFLSNIRDNGNGPQSMFIPRVAYVDPKEANEFEMYGASGIMVDVRTRKQIAA